MNKLKIIQLLPELNIGGVERGTKDLSRALVERGHESIVISNGGFFENDIIKEGAKHIKLPVHKKSLFSFFLSKSLRTIYEKEKPNIVHVRSRMPAWINYFAYKNLKHKPVLLSTFHGLYSIPIYSQVMSKADHMIAISDTVKNYIIDTYNIDEKNITTIPRGCDKNQFNNYKIEDIWLEKWYKEYPQTKDKIILTLPARISKWKGVDSFIELISKLNPNKFHGLVVGPVSDSKKRYYKKLEKKILNHNIKNINFTGSRNDIANIYKISDIVFNLSIKPEPFGRTTIEAISCGSKFIGWNHGGTKEILEKLFPNGLVKLGNSEALKAKVYELLDKNLTPSENTFTSIKMINKTINLYNQLTSSD